MRLAPPPRVVDSSLLLAVLASTATGLVSLVSGTPDLWWVFALHGVAGLALVVLLGWKLRRVAPRLRPSRWTARTVASVLALLAAAAALGTGLFWSFGGNFRVLRWNAMNVHILFALLLAPPLAVHLTHRFRLPSQRKIADRRTALQYLLLVGGAVIAWRLQRVVVSVLGLAADRRFTSSRERGETPGNTFPVTMWVADDPDPIEVPDWSLRVTGAVGRPYEFDYEGLLGIEDELRAPRAASIGRLNRYPVTERKLTHSAPGSGSTTSSKRSIPTPRQSWVVYQPLVQSSVARSSSSIPSRPS